MFKNIPAPIRYISMATVVLALVMSFDLIEILRGGYGWRWGYVPGPPDRRLPLIVTALVYVIGATVILGRTKKARWSLLWAVAGTCVLTLGVIYTREPEPLQTLYNRTASNGVTGPHYAANHIDWPGGEWRDWTAVMEKIGSHIRTSPPGSVIVHGAITDFIGRFPSAADAFSDPAQVALCKQYDLLDYSAAEWAAGWFGVLIPLIAALTALPIYAIARRLQQGDARQAALWWALVPAVTGFAASWSTLYPLISATAMLFLIIGLEKEKPLPYVLGAGIIAGVGSFINFALLPLFGLSGFYTLGVWWRRHRQNRAGPVVIGAVYGVGAALIWVIYMLVGGDSPLAILKASLDAHLVLDRPYEFWVWFHLWDFALWTGVGLIALALLYLWRNRRQPPLLITSAILTLLVMTISGTTQGESGRIWLFMSPFVLIGAWQGLTMLTRRPGAWAMLTGSHALLMVVLTAYLLTMTPPFAPPPPPPAITSTETLPVGATFRVTDVGDTFRLESFSATQTEDGIRLALQWHDLQRVKAVYWFGALLVAPDGTTVPMHLWQPHEDEWDRTHPYADDPRYPTTCWTPGTRFEDVVTLPLPADAPSGEWWISFTVYGDASQPEGRLQVTLADGTQDSQVGLGPVSVGD